MRLNSIIKKAVIGLATIVFVIIGIPTIATLCSQAWVKMTSPPPLLRETANTTPIHVHIGNDDFLIPANYFPWPYSERSKREQTAAIRVHWPDMSGATEETIRIRKKYVGHLNRITMVIHGKPITVDPAVGRLRYYSRLLNRKYDKYKEPIKIYGLIYHENISQNKVVSFRDVFIDNLKKPRTLITCISVNVPKEKIPYPSCDHSFEYKKLRISLSYSKKYLPRWKEIQTSVVQLLDQFSENYKTSLSNPE